MERKDGVSVSVRPISLFFLRNNLFKTVLGRTFMANITPEKDSSPRLCPGTLL